MTESRTFLGLVHRHLTAFPATLVVAEDVISVEPRFMAATVVERDHASEVRFRWRPLGRVLEVHPEDCAASSLIVFRPLRAAWLEAELRRTGWLTRRG